MKKLNLKQLNRVDTETFKAQTKAPFVLVLDNIRSAHNVGAAFRTADAFGIEKIVLCGITAQPPHREILKSAIGATESVIWQYEKEVTTALQQLKAESYQLVGVEQTDESVSLEQIEVEREGRYALIFGNEVMGLSDVALPFLDAAVEVPQFGTKHSLNVSVCLGIVLWEYFRQWKYAIGS